MKLMPEQATLLLPFRNPPLNSADLLRVGVVLDPNQSKPWVDALLTFLRGIPGIDVNTLTAPYRGLAKLKKPAWLVDRLYSMSRTRFDPFGEVALDATDPAVLESIDTIRDAGCEVIIWLAGRQCPDIDLRSLAKHGVFTVQLGGRDRSIPFWDEVARSSVTSAATIFWHNVSLKHGYPVRKAETSTTQGLYLTSNAEQPLVSTIRMLADLCLEVQRGGPLFEERALGLPSERLVGPEPLASPSNFEAARFVAAKLKRSAQMRWSTRGKTSKWFIAMRPNHGESIIDPARLNLTGFSEVPLPKGVEAMADPFLCEAGGRHYLLFEELAAKRSLGRLGCVEVLPDGAFSEMQIILDKPYHLSYPCVVNRGGDLFLIPETAGANRVDIYRFSQFPWRWSLSRRRSRGWLSSILHRYSPTAIGTSLQLWRSLSSKPCSLPQPGWRDHGPCIPATPYLPPSETVAPRANCSGEAAGSFVLRRIAR